MKLNIYGILRKILDGKLEEGHSGFDVSVFVMWAQGRSLVSSLKYAYFDMLCSAGFTRALHDAYSTEHMEKGAWIECVVSIHF